MADDVPVDILLGDWFLETCLLLYVASTAIKSAIRSVELPIITNRLALIIIRSILLAILWFPILLFRSRSGAKTVDDRIEVIWLLDPAGPLWIMT
ncbi:MAG: hypothetical protein IBX64_02140 [Actinobacteria bacterium]|nr:hypothetical protein [Actinomycetota bacterium]